MGSLVIGDIHGCYEELQELLSAAALSDDDQIIALGDVVDRGCDSPRVLNFFATHSNACSLMGNHERKHVRALAGLLRPALSQAITRLQIGEENYEAACRRMHGFPTSVELPEAVLVHGFFEPGIPLAEQRDTVIVGTLTGEEYLRKHFEQPWHELYDGGKPILVGHRDYLETGEPFVWKERVYGLDTSCVKGGRLTGLLIPEFRLVSVKSRCDYRRRCDPGFPPEATILFTHSMLLSWSDLQFAIDLCRSNPAFGARVAERLEVIIELLEEGTRALNLLASHVGQTNALILKRLRSTTNYDDLPHRDQVDGYKREIDDSAIAGFLLTARRGQFDTAYLRARLRSPERLIKFVKDLGL